MPTPCGCGSDESGPHAAGNADVRMDLGTASVTSEAPKDCTGPAAGHTDEGAGPTADDDDDPNDEG
jgi:hypothetical protein